MNFHSLLIHATAWDVAVFRFINEKMYVRFLADGVFFLGHDVLILTFLLAAALAYGLWTGWKKGLSMVFWCGLAVLCSNLLHNQMLKSFFNRPRPFLTLPDVHLCVPLNDLASVSLSFPSTHAASAMAIAVLAGGLDSRLRVWALLFALGIGWGTIYSGGHYPVDVAAGFGIGLVLGWALLKCYRMLWPGLR